MVREHIMAELDIKKAEELEKKYDSGLQTRELGPWMVYFTYGFSILFAIYHYVTAGIGVPVDYWHMGVHMSGVILLVFIGFPAIKSAKSMSLILASLGTRLILSCSVHSTRYLNKLFAKGTPTLSMLFLDQF